MRSTFAILEIRGIPLAQRSQVEAAVLEGGQHLPEGFEGWIVPARRPPGYAVRVIGPRGFYREVKFEGHEEAEEITHHTRRTLSLALTATNSGQ